MEKIGEHTGLMNYTIGQRKGLGLGGGPWYVVAKDSAENIVYVSQGYDVETQYGKTVPLDDFNFITENPWGDFTDPVDITFKIRHTPEFTKGKLFNEGNGSYRIESEDKIQGIAPGQYGVIYDPAHRICYGSGVIRI